MVVVICLEGCHGSGKSALVSHFEESGFPVLDEGFMTMPSSMLHPQTLLMETTWVCAWFQRIIDHVSKSPKGACPVVIADRSPFSAMFYSRKRGELLEPLIRTYMEEVATAAGVHVVSAHLRTDRPLLWTRIQDRLGREPHRMALNEDSEEWMDRTLAFYDGMRWDATVPNNEHSIHEIAAAVLKGVASINNGVFASSVEEALQSVKFSSVATAASLDLNAKLAAVSLHNGQGNEEEEDGEDAQEREDDDGPSAPSHKKNATSITGSRGVAATPQIQVRGRAVSPAGDPRSAGASTPSSASSSAVSSWPLSSPVPVLSLEGVSGPSSSSFSTSSSVSSEAPLLLSLDGNIGAGKSTLLKALRLACPTLVCVKEPVDEWLEMKGADGRSILELFYADPKKWAYAFQHTTLLTRIANTREAVSSAPPGSIVVSERSILTDRHVFATMLRDQGTLDQLEWDLYKRWYEKLAGETPVSAVLYLTTDPDVCEERIARRNRPGEVVDKGYLRDLHVAHQSWLSSAGVPTLHVSFHDGDDPEEHLVPLIRDFIEQVRTGTAPATPILASTAVAPVAVAVTGEV